MKIEGHRPNAESSSSQRVDVKDSAPGERQAQVDRQADRVQVSREASLVGEALRAADETPGIRREVVERARVQLASGEVGRDAGKLADTLIDHMLGR